VTPFQVALGTEGNLEDTSMRLRIATSGAAAEINLKGALTIGRPVEELERAVATLISARVADITLNLAAVPYADGSGLGALVSARISARAAGVALRIAGATGKMREILDLTCLENLRRAEPAIVEHPPRTDRDGALGRLRAFHLSKLIAHVA
jgi:anti-anti-sigma factor